MRNFAVATLAVCFVLLYAQAEAKPEPFVQMIEGMLPEQVKTAIAPMRDAFTNLASTFKAFMANGAIGELVNKYLPMFNCFMNAMSQGFKSLSFQTAMTEGQKCFSG